MSWSTRQIAELAGTTVKAVRHYHETGLLDRPVRMPNGYKQYQAAHLVRLMQIRRLRDLDVPLPRIAALLSPDLSADEATRALDTELTATIDRLERARADLALALRHRTALDVPPAFAHVADDLSPADRALVTIYTQVVGGDTARDRAVQLAIAELYDPAEPDVLERALDRRHGERIPVGPGG